MLRGSLFLLAGSSAFLPLISDFLPLVCYNLLRVIQQKRGLSVANFHSYLRELPAVDRLLKEPLIVEMLEQLPRRLILAAIQDVLQGYRQKICAVEDSGYLKASLDLSPARLAQEAVSLAQERAGPRMRPVINATGIVLHTNLGRAPLAPAAAQVVAGILERYCNLEIDLAEGVRGSRQAHLEGLICDLTGAEAAVVVNNNAAAVFLLLNSCTAGKEVIVSRGQLVEIGGSFRLPEVMAAGGARLVEVGTTNKTYLHDYERAITENTAALLKVHTSNYHLIGFTASIGIAEMVDLAHAHKLLALEDLGSGVLIDITRYGLPREPRVQDSIAAGMDLVTFSGDKLLGGPQAGIIVGRRHLVERIRSNQLARIMRVDKITVAALEATLRLYLDEEKAVQEIPIWRALTAPLSQLQDRAENMAARLKTSFGEADIELLKGSSRVGGGALPMAELPTVLLSLRIPHVDPSGLAGRLRCGNPPVIVRLQQERLLLDLRTVEPEQEEPLLEALVAALEGDQSPFQGQLFINDS
ncbi:MAG: L-seryl-tRNA(Sec) selenium transferase [Firmicutes bacterium]|nr:L-seryl-tRNA(Sec) selenium transferase [Bacillota bacterium]